MVTTGFHLGRLVVFSFNPEKTFSKIFLEKNSAWKMKCVFFCEMVPFFGVAC